MVANYRGITVVGEAHKVPAVMEEELRIIRDIEPDTVLFEGWDDYPSETLDAMLNASAVWRSQQDIEDYFAERYDVDIFEDTVEPDDDTGAAAPAGDMPVRSLPEGHHAALKDAAATAFEAAYDAAVTDTALAQDYDALHHVLGLGRQDEDLVRFKDELRQYYWTHDVSYAGCDINKWELFMPLRDHDRLHDRVTALRQQLAVYDAKREETMAKRILDAAEEGEVLAVVGHHHVEYGRPLRRTLNRHDADYDVVSLTGPDGEEGEAYAEAYAFDLVSDDNLERVEAQYQYADAIVDAPVADYTPDM